MHHAARVDADLAVARETSGGERSSVHAARVDADLAVARETSGGERSSAHAARVDADLDPRLLRRGI